MLHEPDGRDAKTRALEEFYGADVPQSTVDRVMVRDDDALPDHAFVD